MNVFGLLNICYLNFETKQHVLFSKSKKLNKSLNLNFKFSYLPQSHFFSHGQTFLNDDMNNKWCEGKNSPTINKVNTKEKPLRLLNSEEFAKFMLPIIRHNIAHLGNVADLGNLSGLEIVCLRKREPRNIKTDWCYMYNRLLS